MERIFYVINLVLILSFRFLFVFLWSYCYFGLKNYIFLKKKAQAHNWLEWTTSKK